MQDFKARGTGDSRFLKSVADFKTRYPTYDDFVEALVSGTLPIDINGFNTDGTVQRGTPYNVASVLQDATCEKLGLPNTATPNDAFNALAEGAGGGGVYFGTCDTAANDGNKIVNVEKLSSLKNGTKITVFFRNGRYTQDSRSNLQKPSYLTLNVNGLGEIPVNYLDTTSGAGLSASWGSYGVVDFVFVSRADNPGSRFWVMSSPSIFAATTYRGSYAGNSGTVELVSPGFVQSGIIVKEGSGQLEFGVLTTNSIIAYSGSEFTKIGTYSSGGQGTYTLSFSGTALNASGSTYLYSFVCAASF